MSLKMDKSDRKRIGDVFTFLRLASVFILTDGLALLVTSTFESMGVTAFENPNDPTDLIYFFVTMLVFTGLILLLSRFFHRRILHGVFLGATGLTYFYVFSILLATVIFKYQ